MMLAPDALGDRYEVYFYGDDIVWLHVGEDGKIYGMNPEYGAFGVAKDTNWKSNPTAMDAIKEALHQRRLQPRNPRAVVGRKDPGLPRRCYRMAGLEGRKDFRPPGRSAALRGQGRRVGTPQFPLHHVFG